MPHPYTTTVHGLDTLIEQLRSVFPPKLTPETLRSWKIGRSNESSLLSTLRFLGIIGEHRRTLPAAGNIFALRDDEFAESFGQLVKEAYFDLFDHFGESAWTLSRDELISFMRTVDGLSARVADQQAVTFQALVRHAGRGISPFRSSPPPKREKATASVGKRTDGPTPMWAKSSRIAARGAESFHVGAAGHANGDGNGSSRAGPHIDINVNLPITDDAAVYDAIFRSIRAHLLED